MITPWLILSQLPIATTFNGNSHVELHPPKNLEDIKAFTAFDLFINRHHNNSSEADVRRKRRQNKRRDASFFVLYLGSKDVSGPQYCKNEFFYFQIVSSTSLNSSLLGTT